jgi:hypothetical protein
VAQPVEASLDLASVLDGVPLVFTQLVSGEGICVGLRVMFAAEPNHAVRLVMLPLFPRRVEVVVVEIGIQAIGHRADEALGLPQFFFTRGGFFSTQEGYRRSLRNLRGSITRLSSSPRARVVSSVQGEARLHL